MPTILATASYRHPLTLETGRILLVQEGPTYAVYWGLGCDPTEVLTRTISEQDARASANQMHTTMRTRHGLRWERPNSSPSRERHKSSPTRKES